MNRWAPYYLSALRIVTGVLFALHGAATFWGFLDGRRSSPDVFAWPSWWGAAIQLVGGLLIAAGALTRPAAVIASGSMAYAYFAFHAGDGLSRWRTTASSRSSTAGCSCSSRSPAPGRSASTP